MELHSNRKCTHDAWCLLSLGVRPQTQNPIVCFMLESKRFKWEFALNRHSVPMFRTRLPHADIMLLKQNKTQIQWLGGVCQDSDTFSIWIQSGEEKNSDTSSTGVYQVLFPDLFLKDFIVVDCSHWGSDPEPFISRMEHPQPWWSGPQTPLSEPPDHISSYPQPLQTHRGRRPRITVRADPANPGGDRGEGEGTRERDRDRKGPSKSIKTTPGKTLELSQSLSKAISLSRLLRRAVLQ